MEKRENDLLIGGLSARVSALDASVQLLIADVDLIKKTFNYGKGAIFGLLIAAVSIGGVIGKAAETVLGIIFQK
jgi:hypothetical protein